MTVQEIKKELSNILFQIQCWQSFLVVVYKKIIKMEETSKCVHGYEIFKEERKNEIK